MSQSQGEVSSSSPHAVPVSISNLQPKTSTSASLASSIRSTFKLFRTGKSSIQGGGSAAGVGVGMGIANIGLSVSIQVCLAIAVVKI